jgi:hypothetical protein
MRECVTPPLSFVWLRRLTLLHILACADSFLLIGRLKFTTMNRLLHENIMEHFPIQDRQLLVQQTIQDETENLLQIATTHSKKKSRQELIGTARKLPNQVLALIFSTLAFNSHVDADHSRSVASAMESVAYAEAVDRDLAKRLMKALLCSYEQLPTRVDLRIVTHFARAFQIDCRDNEGFSAFVANVVGPVLATQHDKDSVGPALALISQLKPWSHLSPILAINAAIPLDLWHAAENICVTSDESAVEALIEAAFQAKTYRRADSFCTRFYEKGGKHRYLEARFLHACDTIAKLVCKGSVAVIERQVERVDRAVLRVAAESSCLLNKDLQRTASPDIRRFALTRLEDAANIGAAQRYAEIWGMEYRCDEETLAATAQARKAKYIQWEDVHDGEPPDLISTPEQLLESFREISDGIFGFDVEWSDEAVGADLLQIATEHMTFLIDITALSATVEGANALETTIGRIFASNHCRVVGFNCTQDVSKLRSSPCARSIHWLDSSAAVVDVQSIVTLNDVQLGKHGLSRVCERFLGKALDKSEQCSSWIDRPLTRRQRVYAALDAWVCVKVYDKVAAIATESKTDIRETKMQKV